LKEIFQKEPKMMSNKVVFAFVLIGLIGLTTMVSGQDDPTTKAAPTTTAAPTTPYTGSPTTENPDNGCGNVSAGLLFSLCSAIFYIIF